MNISRFATTTAAILIAGCFGQASYAETPEGAGRPPEPAATTREELLDQNQMQNLVFDFKVTRGKFKNDIHLHGKVPKECRELIDLEPTCDATANTVTFTLIEKKIGALKCLSAHLGQCKDDKLKACISLDDLTKERETSDKNFSAIFKKESTDKTRCDHIDTKKAELKFMESTLIPKITAENGAAQTEGTFCPTCAKDAQLKGLKSQAGDIQAITDRASPPKKDHEEGETRMAGRGKGRPPMDRDDDDEDPPERPRGKPGGAMMARGGTGGQMSATSAMSTGLGMYSMMNNSMGSMYSMGMQNPYASMMGGYGMMGSSMYSPSMYNPSLYGSSMYGNSGYNNMYNMGTYGNMYGSGYSPFGYASAYPLTLGSQTYRQGPGTSLGIIP